MKSKLKIIIPVLLVLLGGAYKFVLAKPKPGKPPKVAGTVYVLPKDFLANLRDGKFAKFDVALVLKKGYEAAPPAKKEGSAAPAVDGYGPMPQEPLVRAIVTDQVTDSTARSLTTKKGRRSLVKRIKALIDKRTDVEVDDVLFTDVAVQ